MAPQFIEHYGYHDDEFTDGEDTLQYVYTTCHCFSGVDTCVHMSVHACGRVGGGWGGCRGYNTDKIKFVIVNCSDHEDIFLFCK